MVPYDNSADSREPQKWEQEVLAGHRWGRLFRWFKIDKDRGLEELARLKKLWEAAQPLSRHCETIMEQIIALEICNWNLEESILALCCAIGDKEPAELRIGHIASVSEERWKKVWAYYLTLRNWLPCKAKSGYETLLRVCDSDKTIQNHILSLLGGRDELKELYVERLCFCLEFWLGGYFLHDSAQMKAHNAAVSAVEKEIKQRDPEGQILNAFHPAPEGYGKLNPCHHKVFRRYDIILSSIGAGKWRAAMPMRGIDGYERAATLENFLSPIRAWIGARGEVKELKQDELAERIYTLLGKPDNTKLFLASLLISLLGAQQLAAERRAENRDKN